MGLSKWQKGQKWYWAIVCYFIGHDWDTDWYLDHNDLPDGIDYCKRCGYA